MSAARRVRPFALLLPAAMCACAPAPQATTAAAQPPVAPRAADRADRIDQIGQASHDLRPSRIAAPTTATARVTQLPADRVALSGADPEADLASAGVAPVRRQDLYREVAVAWEAIRARGQQPTPELIAQAVGPETLARFLTAFPDARNLFDTQKVDVPPPEPPQQQPALPPTEGDKGR